MEWTNSLLRFGNFVLQEFYELDKRFAEYNGIDYRRLDKDLKDTITDREMVLVKEELTKLDLLDVHYKGELHRITDKGRDLIRNYKSLELYLKDLMIKQQKRAKRLNWKERKENHLLSLQILKHWAGLVAFIISIGFNIYLYTDLAKLKAFIKPEKGNIQTMSSDSIVNPKSELKEQTSKPK